jgi:hypothetical protein
MEIKKQYEINDDVWIHIGTGKLHKGKVVEYFDLGHIGRSRDIEYYVIELPTSIEPILEVRTWEEISQDAKGPLACYRNLKENAETFKKLGKLGIEMPIKQDILSEVFDDCQDEDPTPEQVNAALDRSIKSRNDNFVSTLSNAPKKRVYRKKNERRSRPKTV